MSLLLIHVSAPLQCCCIYTVCMWLHVFLQNKKMQLVFHSIQVFKKKSLLAPLRFSSFTHYISFYSYRNWTSLAKGWAQRLPVILPLLLLKQHQTRCTAYYLHLLNVHNPTGKNTLTIINNIKSVHIHSPTPCVLDRGLKSKSHSGNMGTRSWLVLTGESSPYSLLMASSTQVATSHLTYISFVSLLPFLYRQRVRITTPFFSGILGDAEDTGGCLKKKKYSFTPNNSTSSGLNLNLHAMKMLHLRFAFTKSENHLCRLKAD